MTALERHVGQLEPHWEVFRTELAELSHPAQVAGRRACWSGHHHAPLIGNLFPDVDPDHSDWWMFTTVPVQAAGILVLESVFGHAELWIDQRYAGLMDNGFRKWRFPLAASGRDVCITLCFRGLDALLAERMPRPRWSPGLVKHPNLRWFRQPLTGRLRGWSDRRPLVGLGAPTRIETDAAHSRRVVDATLEAGMPVLHLQCPSVRDLENLIIRVNGESLRPGEPRATAADSVCVSLSLPDLAPWYPHTHGYPALHEVTLEERTGSRQTLQVGFRDIRIDQESGEFLVNGEYVFMRGACWMPPLDPLADPASLIDEARTAGFNMLRITGTSWYGPESFYSACDRNGILVWQDLPLASMDYPSSPDFITGVLAELNDQLPRLAAHPSLAVVCGSSDGQQQATYHGLSAERRRPGALEESLAACVGSHLGQHRYVAATPGGGGLPTHTDRGFSSYFGVGAYLRSVQDRGIERVAFATEALGFANIPSIASLLRQFGSATPQVTSPAWKQGVPRDAGAGWDFEDVRDHYTRELFGIDPHTLRHGQPARYLELSAVTSGIAMALTMARWRTAEARCNGALIWTLNDREPGAGWGLFDAFGVPKPAFFLLRSVCRPVQVLVTDEGLDGHRVHLVNERDEAVDALLQVELIRPDGRRGASHAAAVTLPPRSNSALSIDALYGRFQDTTWSHRFGPPTCGAVCAALISPDDPMNVISQHLVGVGNPLVEPSARPIVRSSIERNGQVLQLTLESDRLLQYVQLEADGWAPDDQFFHVVPGRPLRVRLTSVQGDDFPASLRLKAVNVPAALNIGSTSDASH